MTRASSGPCLTAVFVDYDNIYLSLKRKDDAAARRFAKDAGIWLRAIEDGSLLTPTNNSRQGLERRIVMARCYGNPVPRRNNSDNSTDMSSFPFVRHHFLRAGFEICDCPPLTQQLKNSSDIRMVMDASDFLNHETYFEEFIILSGDADFTPLLHRLRSHARHTAIYANDHTASPYSAISDGEIRQDDLIALLGGGQFEVPNSDSGEDQRSNILAEVLSVIRDSNEPVPIEALADRAQRALGHDRTVGTSWAGYGQFRPFLTANLPSDIQLTENPPYLAFEPLRHGNPEASAPEISDAGGADDHSTPPGSQPAGLDLGVAEQAETASFQLPPISTPQVAPEAQPVSDLQASIARIHRACQVPPLAPPQYRVLFEVMAAEISENGLLGAQSITNINDRAVQAGLSIQRDDVRFALDVVSEADPWFEQGSTVNLFAGRFRNYVVARCRSEGMNLTADELDLVDAWFVGSAPTPQLTHQPGMAMPPMAQQQARAPMPPAAGRVVGSAPLSKNANPSPDERGAGTGDMPRIIRSQMRG